MAGKVAVGRRDRKCGRKKVAAAEIIGKANLRYRGEGGGGGKQGAGKRKRGGRRAEFSLRGPVEERRSVSEEKRKGEKIAS